MKILYISYQSH